MHRAAEGRAGEGQSGHLIARCRLCRRVERGLHGRQMILRGYGQVGVGPQYLAHIRHAPQAEQRRLKFVDQPRKAHHCRPDQCGGPQQVMQVQPCQARGPVTPDRAERQPLHEPAIQHRAGDQGGYEDTAHEAEKQPTGQIREQTDMQTAANAHDQARPCAGRLEFCLGSRLFQHFRRAGVELDPVAGIPVRIFVVILQRLPAWGHRNQHCGFVIVRINIGDDLARIECPRFLHDDIEAGVGRSGRQNLIRRIIITDERVPDLLGKQQRQTGHAHDQQEQRADQARPFMDHEPAAECSGGHENRTLTNACKNKSQLMKR
ncbi:hypothetical protein GLUCOINTEAF2_0203176 [Komagataeibacter intermedius AF2]|uniref:Uncharacterized protein n=1 Tax=Komagataeibacter intermedius AF2 TaxID=1458464 RepID=A0A0N1F9I3_9PROT|nr:hypothetical protein GLUCOINTEAF2_0203176 [Komagataeibacter intermedius AF2]